MTWKNKSWADYTGMKRPRYSDPVAYANHLRLVEKEHWQQELENLVCEDEAMMNLGQYVPGLIPRCSYDEEDEDTYPEDYES